MIPRIIHYCWFGNNPMPANILSCIASWEKHLPDYTFKKWSEETYIIENSFAINAYKNKSWAFLVDYVRFDVLYQYGGIYLDTDMLLLKNLDYFLENECFLGYEDNDFLNAAIIGAIPSCDFVKECLTYYSYADYSENMPTISKIITRILKKTNSTVVTFPPDFFYPLPFKSRTQNINNFITQNSYSVHLWNASWFNEWLYFQNDFKKDGFLMALSTLRKTPIQPIQYYIKLLIAMTPNHIKSNLKKIITWLIRIALYIPIIREKIIYSEINYHSRYHYFPIWNSYNLTSFKKITRKDINYNINIGEYNGWRVYFNVFSNGTQALFNTIKQDFNIIDVGANLGYYTLNFAKKANQGKIISFEPFLDNYQNLKLNISLNQFKNINTYQIALGDSCQKVNMEHPVKRNLGMVQIKNLTEAVDTFIEMTTLDTFIKKNPLKINLIKIDIEGYEMNFLRGAKEVLINQYPILFVELSDSHLKKYNSSAEQLVSYLEQIGYNNIINADTGVLIDSTSFLENCFMDIFCRKI
jgi:FkbM family methyltransferase